MRIISYVFLLLLITKISSIEAGEISLFDKCSIVGHLSGSNNYFEAAIGIRMIGADNFKKDECNLGYKNGQKYGELMIKEGSVPDDEAKKLLEISSNFSSKIYDFIISEAFKNKDDWE